MPKITQLFVLQVNPDAWILDPLLVIHYACTLLLKLNMKLSNLGILLKCRFGFWSLFKCKFVCVLHVCTYTHGEILHF